MKKLEDMGFADDFMFGQVMKKEEFCKHFIEIVLDTKISKIVYKETQKTEKLFFDTKGVRFDAYVEADGTIFEIEMQATKCKNLPRRSRLYTHGGRVILPKAKLYRDHLN